MAISKLNRAGDRRGMHMLGRKLSEEHKNNIRLGCEHPVYQYDKSMNFIKEWNSVGETNIQHVGDVCNGKRKTAGGFIWKWKKDYDIIENLEYENRQTI